MLLNMKKIFYVAAVALAFAACSKDEVKLDSLTVTPETVTNLPMKFSLNCL